MIPSRHLLLTRPQIFSNVECTKDWMSDVKIRKHFQLDHLVGQVKKCFRVHVNSVVLMVCINSTPNPHTSERRETPNPSPSQLHSAAQRSGFEVYHKRHLHRRMVWNIATRGSSIRLIPWLLKTNWNSCHYVVLSQRSSIRELCVTIWRLSA